MLLNRFNISSALLVNFGYKYLALQLCKYERFVEQPHVAKRALHANVYVNRKNYHSINVHLICSAHMAILNAVARWPVLAHKFFIVCK